MRHEAQGTTPRHRRCEKETPLPGDIPRFFAHPAIDFDGREPYPSPQGQSRNRGTFPP
jgi:hypothetical protein